MSETTRPPISPWHPLRIPIFRNLLIADLVSDIRTFMQGVGAAWLMTSLTNRPVFIESFLVDSWAEHQRQHRRFTMADHELETRVLSYAIKPITVKHYIYARKE